jgi:[ribosomal protein S5]-alanine N-acetyltransferase
MKIICSQFTIRELRQGDERSMAAYANNFNVFVNLRDHFPFPYSIDNAIEFVNMNRGIDPPENFCIDYKNECIGIVGFLRLSDVYRKSAEIGYWLGEPFWGKGIMTEAVKKISLWLFDNYDIVRLQAGIFEWNKGSMRVLEKAGFKFEGISEKAILKNGKLIDEYRYGLVKG